MFHEHKHCRICGNTDLRPVVDLGHQYLSGVFPRNPAEPLTQGPLQLVKCQSREVGASCGLVQLLHSYEPAEMYGHNYGYRSSLNGSMVDHLQAKARWLAECVGLRAGDLVLDIGSNDGTMLSFYPERGTTLVGMDPSAANFRKYYKPHIEVIEDFFSAERFAGAFGTRKARLVTSVAMFYDLESPVDFARQVRDILADDGLWHLEQSYLPTMLRQTSYDTICHEHVEYYGLAQIKWIMDRCGLKIVDVTLNDVNGGSFAVTVARQGAPFPEAVQTVERLLAEEAADGINELATYEQFSERIRIHREQQRSVILRLCEAGKKVLGYGASTKGNIILQYCGITPDIVPFIAEVNRDKFGCFTPGTNIPIISEQEAKELSPDYLLVLPWHFRANLLRREAAFLRAGGKMIFPLPEIEVASA